MILRMFCGGNIANDGFKFRYSISYAIHTKVLMMVPCHHCPNNQIFVGPRGMLWEMVHSSDVVFFLLVFIHQILSLLVLVYAAGFSQAERNHGYD